MKEFLEQSKPEAEDTLLNFALIFKCTVPVFEGIKLFLLKNGASLIYQTKSADRIYIKKEAEERQL